MLEQLWAQVQKYIEYKAKLYFNAWGDKIATIATVEDLVQSGYIAMARALKYYKPDSGYKFTTLLNYTLKTEFHNAVGIKLYSNDGIVREAAIKLVSLDAPLSGAEDDEGNSLYEILPAQNIDDPERTIYLEQLKKVLDTALSKLPERQELIIRRRYYEDQTCDAIGREVGCTSQNISEQEKKALRTLRANGHEFGLDQFIEINTNYYPKWGVKAFQNTGMSAVEKTVLNRERLAKAWMRKHGVL